MTPTLVDVSEGVPWPVHLTDMDVVFRCYHFKTSVQARMHLGDLYILEAVLTDLACSRDRSFRFRTLEGNFGLRIWWCNMGSDIALKGSIPSEEQYDRACDVDPKSARDTILLRNVFELWQEPALLIEPCKRVSEVLSQIRRAGVEMVPEDVTGSG